MTPLLDLIDGGERPLAPDYYARLLARVLRELAVRLAVTS